MVGELSAGWKRRAAPGCRTAAVVRGGEIEADPLTRNAGEYSRRRPVEKDRGVEANLTDQMTRGGTAGHVERGPQAFQASVEPVDRLADQKRSTRFVTAAILPRDCEIGGEGRSNGDRAWIDSRAERTI